MKIGELSSQVNRLICVCREKNTERTVSESSSSTDNIPNKDEQCMIISHSRSVDQILKWLENYQIEGRDFVDGNLSRSFRNMRTSIVCHLQSENHQKKHCLVKEMRNEEWKVMKKGNDCGINCAEIAYTTLFFFESAKSYEHHIADVYNCGGLVGSKNQCMVSLLVPAPFIPC